jgi:hypothetical protein
MKATGNAVTHPKSKRTAVDAQPFPRVTPQTTRQERLETLSDAEVLVGWLNAAIEANATRSYARVVLILMQLEQLRELRASLREYNADPHAEQAAIRELKKQRALVEAGEKGQVVRFPGRNTNTETYKKLYRKTERLHSGLNDALSKYSFVPRVTLFLARDDWHGGMVPSENSRWFQIKVIRAGKLPQTISEADAVLSLVRLDLIGEIGKVRPCQKCQIRWCVRTRSTYRFCGKECREAFYAKHPDYHTRKADAQRKYRLRKKLKEVSESRSLHS